MAGIVLYTDICLIVLLIAGITVGLFRLRRVVHRESLIALQRSRRWAIVRAGCSQPPLPPWAPSLWLWPFTRHPSSCRAYRFFVGPALRSAGGLAVFRSFPAASINGEVHVRVAEIHRRSVSNSGFPRLASHSEYWESSHCTELRTEPGRHGRSYLGFIVNCASTRPEWSSLSPRRPSY
jgi:hypothetical protein